MEVDVGRCLDVEFRGRLETELGRKAEFDDK